MGLLDFYKCNMQKSLCYKDFRRLAQTIDRAVVDALAVGAWWEHAVAYFRSDKW